MKIGILIGHPTQFEGPFFQHAAKDKAHQLRVIYSDRARMDKVFDPELSASVSWGIDLLGGYDYVTMPRRRRLRWLLRDIRHQKYDLLIINGYSRGEYAFAALVARLFGTPLALRLDTVPFNNASSRKRIQKKLMFSVFSKLYNHFFAIGGLTVEYLLSLGIKRERISIFSYAVDTDYFREKSSLSEEEKRAVKSRYGLPAESQVVLSVAKFNDRESPWDLVKAFCALPDKNLWLLLIGDGEERVALEAYVRQYPQSHVVFGGYIPYPELPSVYSVSDVFVHPAQDEPWGVSVAEAMSCGLPVIASSRVGAGDDLIVPGKNGDVYEVGDIDDLKHKLKELFFRWQPAQVRAENERVLDSWNYKQTWRNILEGGQRLRKTS